MIKGRDNPFLLFQNERHMTATIPPVLQAFFNQKVEVTETPQNYRGQTRYVCDIAPTDTTIQQFRDAAAQEGLTVRVWLPGTGGTMDMKGNRLNVHVGQSFNGDWKIEKLNIG